MNIEKLVSILKTCYIDLLSVNSYTSGKPFTIDIDGFIRELIETDDILHPDCWDNELSCHFCEVKLEYNTENGWEMCISFTYTSRNTTREGPDEHILLEKLPPGDEWIGLHEKVLAPTIDSVYLSTLAFYLWKWADSKKPGVMDVLLEDYEQLWPAYGFTAVNQGVGNFSFKELGKLYFVREERDRDFEKFIKRSNSNTDLDVARYYTLYTILVKS